MKKIYISGPMSGLPELNYPAFNAAEVALKAHDYEPLNPARIEVPEGFKPDWTWYMRQAMKMMMDADGLALLDGWTDSEGATWERHFAMRLGMEVHHLSAWLS